MARGMSGTSLSRDSHGGVGGCVFGPEVDLPADRGIHHLVAEHVIDRPHQHAAVDSDGRMLTYEQLWRWSATVAAALAARGVGRGDRVAVTLDRSLELVATLLGIARIGAAYVPLDSLAPTDRVSFVIAEAQTRVVVCADEAAGWPIPAGVTRLTVPAMAMPSQPGTPADPAELMDPDVPAPIDAEDPLYVAYTSGSTGLPKGVVIPHRAVLRLVTKPYYCPLGPGDRVAQLANPAFDATTFEVWSTLAAGATIVILPPVVETAVGEWRALLRRHQISTMFLTTAVFGMIARGEPDAFSALDTLLFGGEAADPEAVRRVLAAGPPNRLVNAYGPTETTTFATCYDCTPDSITGLERIPIGRPLQNTTLRVVDEELRPVPSGEPGELCIGGSGVALGYLHRPELTARRFRPEHTLTGPVADSGTEPVGMVYRTGDLVRQLPDGAVEFLGRLDRQVKLRGFRIELEEIERAMMATGLVTAAVVEKVGDGLLAHLVAFFAPAGTAASEMAEVSAAVSQALRDRLPRYMMPTRWVVLSGLPLTGTGKIDRTRLLAGLNTADSPAQLEAPTADELCIDVCAALRELLEVPEVRPVDNFFDLGGNSILAIQLAAGLQDRLGVPVEATDVLLTDSVAELAHRIAGLRLASMGTALNG